MIHLPLSTVVLSSLLVLLAGICLWLWKRPSAVAITEAAGDLITALSCEVDLLKKQVHELQIVQADSTNRITMLQGELALANSEVAALEQLIKEQAGRIADLRTENETLRRQIVRVMKKTGALDDPDTDPKR